ncbi:TetR/AcrR family transcriptional regulator [Kribbella pratensis]|uniref:TetR family transcriptional regulator n=1 Tax=Kribbella pratensis TaxID=2512112 RepID=A0A4R8C1X8_9ACTN|nr:TetR/AcrR family transcriptional regulator [Kribbella pratensis]TDW69752.1 TetR family transcriptional regulator [Kribbella pratensis]
MHSKLADRRSGRPLGFDRAEMLDRLMTLFWREGFDGVTQQQMAATTGLSTSSLYNSFGTKIEIYREAVDEYLHRMQEVVEPLTDGERGRDDLLLSLSRLEKLLGGPNAGFGCLATTAMARPVDDHVTRATHRYREQLRSGFRAALRRARTLGESSADPAVMADVFTSAVLGTLVIARADSDGAERSRHLKALRRLVATL